MSRRLMCALMPFEFREMTSPSLLRCGPYALQIKRHYNSIQYVAIILAVRHGGVASSAYIKHADARIRGADSDREDGRSLV